MGEATYNTYNKPRINSGLYNKFTQIKRKRQPTKRENLPEKEENPINRRGQPKGNKKFKCPICN